MRLAIAATLLLVGSSLAAAAAEKSRGGSQEEYRAYKAWQKDRREGRTSSWGQTADTPIGIRANAADASGELKGYPDWARAALGSGTRR